MLGILQLSVFFLFTTDLSKAKISFFKCLEIIFEHRRFFVDFA